MHEAVSQNQEDLISDTTAAYRPPHTPPLLISLPLTSRSHTHTHTRRHLFGGSLINFTVVCRVPSEGVSWRGRDSIGRPPSSPTLRLSNRPSSRIQPDEWNPVDS